MDGAILDGRVFPMTTPDEETEAIAWKEGTIVAVGPRDQVAPIAAELGLPIIEAEGRVVIPGFVDAHMHFLHVGVRRLRPDLRRARRRQAEERTRSWLEENPGDGPVIAEGWDESNWADPDFPTREDLDRLSPDRPLVWRRICGHIAVANSKALPIVLDHWGPDLVDTETGLMLEQASLYLNEVMPVSDDDLDQALVMATAVAHRRGVTAVGEYAQAPFRQAYLRNADRLGVRVACSIYVQQLEDAIQQGMRTGQVHSGFLRDGGLKVFMDGSFGGRTAYMREPYQDDPESGRGMPIWTDEEADKWFQTAHAAGIQIHAHAIGDAAIDQGLDAFERAKAASGATEEAWGAIRHRFEHYELPHDDAVERTVALQITACAQPNFVGAWSAKGGMYERRIGPVFLLNNRYRTFLKEGVELAFGSDGMPFGPLFGVQSAIEHPVEEERLSPTEAIWLYTARAAHAIHWEDEIGRLAPGMKADLVVLGTTDLDVPAREWGIQRTIIDGQTVFEAREEPARGFPKMLPSPH